jgi:hypothetical protein
VNIAAADAARAHADENVVVADCGHRDVGNREPARGAEEKRFQKPWPFAFRRTRMTK